MSKPPLVEFPDDTPNPIPMKIREALVESCKQQDTERFNRLLTQLAQKGHGHDLTAIPLIHLHVNAVGLKCHTWAWNAIEDFLFHRYQE